MAFLHFFKLTYQSWKKNHTSLLGAALTYYAVFSLIPFLAIVTVIASVSFGRDLVAGQITNQLSGIVGYHSAQFIETLIAKTNHASPNLLVSLFGLAVLIWGASSFFSTLKTALDIIWGHTSVPKTGLVHFIGAKLEIFLTVILAGLFLIVFLFINAFSIAHNHFLGYQIINGLVELVVMTVLFGFTFRVMSRMRLNWSDVLVGGLITSVFLIIGNILMGIYLGLGTATSIYGVAGSFVSILIWLYYTFQIFLLGAEITQIYALKHQS